MRGRRFAGRGRSAIVPGHRGRDRLEQFDPVHRLNQIGIEAELTKAGEARF